MVALCSQLFWSSTAAATQAADGSVSESRRDPRRVLECLQRALKIADTCIGSGANVQLFVEVRSDKHQSALLPQ
jgi:vacuolar protein sorting-associated protein 35